MTKIEVAKQLINDYCIAEFGDEPDYSNLRQIGIAYTTVTDEEIDAQIYVDLENFAIERWLMDVLVEKRKYENLDKLIDCELKWLDFDELVSFSDEEIDFFRFTFDPDGTKI